LSSLALQYVAFYLMGTERVSGLWALALAFGFPIALWFLLRVGGDVSLARALILCLFALSVLTFFSVLILFIVAAKVGGGMS
jgi:hypothetical protein